MELDGKFFHDQLNRYTFEISYFVEINGALSIIATHEADRTNNDVVRVVITSRFSAYFPGGIGEVMPNVESLSMPGCQLEKIVKDDLRGFSKLTFLDLYDNLLEELKEDLFENSPLLKFIDLRKNQITAIPEKLLQPLVNLKFFNVERNPIQDGTVKSLQSSVLFIVTKYSFSSDLNLDVLLQKLEDATSAKEMIKSIFHQRFVKQNIDIMESINDAEIKGLFHLRTFGEFQRTILLSKAFRLDNMRKHVEGMLKEKIARSEEAENQTMLDLYNWGFKNSDEVKKAAFSHFQHKYPIPDSLFDEPKIFTDLIKEITKSKEKAQKREESLRELEEEAMKKASTKKRKVE